MFLVLEKLEKLNMLEEKQEIKEEQISYDVDFCLGDFLPKEEELKSIDQLKNERINKSNLLKLMKEQGEEDKELEQEIKELDNEINDYYMNMPEDMALNENIDELMKYMDLVKDNKDELSRVQGIIQRYSRLLNGMEDKFGQNYVEQVVVTKVYGAFDKDLENVISKYDKQFTKEDKRAERQNFIQKQNDMIRQSIKQMLGLLDRKFNTNNTKSLDKLLKYFKSQLSKMVKPEIFSKIINNTQIRGSKNQLLFNSIMQVAKVFVIIFYINNNDVELEKIYENIETFTSNEEHKGKSVLVKSLNKRGTFVGEYENQIYIDMGDKTIRVEQNDIEFLDTWAGKNIKVIRGTKKGMYGTVTTEGLDYVVMTKDFYGKANNGKINTSLHLIKVQKSDIKLFKEQYETPIEEKMNIQYTDLCAFYKNKVVDLYTLVKFNYFQYNNNDDSYKQFNSLFSIALSLFNNLKSNDTLQMDQLTQMKKDFASTKKQLIALKNAKKNKEFIKMKRSLQNNATEIKQLARDLKSSVSVSNIFMIEDGELVNTSEQYNHYIKQSKKVRTKKFKMTKKMVKKVVNEEVSKVSDILADLLL